MNKIVFFILFLSSVIYADMCQLQIEGYFNTMSTRDTVYNYLVNNSTDSILLIQETKIAENITEKDIWHDCTGYYMLFEFRLPIEKLIKLEAVRDTAHIFIVNNNNKIDSTMIKYHICYNDSKHGASKPCKEIIVYSKNWKQE